MASSSTFHSFVEEDDEMQGLKLNPNMELSAGNIMSTDNVLEHADEVEYDLILIQEDYREQCIFAALPPPSWKYAKPPQNLLHRGLTAQAVHDEVMQINRISSDAFRASDSCVVRWIPMLPLIALIIGFVYILLSIINHATPELEYVIIGCSVFATGLLIGMCSCYFAWRTREKSIDEAIKAVMQHVDTALNAKYAQNLIVFEVLEYKTETAIQRARNKKSVDPDYDADDDMIKDFTYYYIGIREKAIDTQQKSSELSRKLLSVEAGET